MKLTNTTIDELGKILNEEFNLQLSPKDLTRLAYFIVGFFDVLIRIETKAQFGNSPVCLIAKG